MIGEIQDSEYAELFSKEDDSEAVGHWKAKSFHAVKLRKSE